jgi:hypothetical protein
MSILDIEDTEFFGFCKSMLCDRVKDILSRKMDDLKETLIENLKHDNISKEMIMRIFQKYDEKIVINLRPFQVKKQRIKRVVNDTRRCMARIGLGTQCSRSKIEGDFCKSHHNSLPYGKIDELKPVKECKNQVKRGKSFSVDDLDMSKYIKTLVLDIAGEEFLIDSNLVIYSGMNIVGRQVFETIEWYNT